MKSCDQKCLISIRRHRRAAVLFLTFLCVIGLAQTANADVIQDKKIYAVIIMQEEILTTAILERDINKIIEIEISLIDIIQSTNALKKAGEPGSSCHSASVDLFVDASFSKAAIERKGTFGLRIRDSILKNFHMFRSDLRACERRLGIVSRRKASFDSALRRLN